MAYRARNILIAVALAVVAALLTGFYVTNYKRHVQRGEDHVTVLVAKRDIPVGTAGSDAAGMMAPTQVPRRSVVPGSISSPDEVKNLVSTQETFAGEQVTTQRFTSVSQTGVEGQLRGTTRAFAIEGDTNQLLAGTLKEGDHVDFVAALKAPTGNQDVFLSRVLIRDLKVLQAPPQESAGSKLTSSGAGNTAVMLAMTDNQAQKVQYVLANASGGGPDRWHLELRPVTHAADSADHIDSFGSVITDGLSARQRRALGR